jgi:hypothetical protein
MRLVTATATAAIAVFISQVLLAQTQPMKPTAPGSTGDPKWQAVLRTSDGRTFVTDGGLAIEAELAKPAKLPERQVAGKLMDTYLSATPPDEFGLSDLTANASGRTYTTPKGIPLNATYINFIRRILPARAVRFRMGGELQPVLIVANGKAVGVLMPVKK